MTVRDDLLAIATPAPSLGDYQPIHDDDWTVIGWTITTPDGTHVPRCARCNTTITAHPDRGMARHRVYRHWHLTHAREAR